MNRPQADDRLVLGLGLGWGWGPVPGLGLTGIASSLGWAGVRGVCEGKGTVGMRCARLGCSVQDYRARCQVGEDLVGVKGPG